MHRLTTITNHLSAGNGISPTDGVLSIASAPVHASSGPHAREYKQAEAVLYPSHVISLFEAKDGTTRTAPTRVSITNVKVHQISRLSEYVPSSALPRVVNVFRKTRWSDTCDQKDIHTPGYNQIIADDHVVLVDIVRKDNGSKEAFSLLRAGPRAEICWQPGEVKAAIVTCGGLCPGLNDVISELFVTLYYNYGVETIYGIKQGYRGFWQPQYQPWQKLTPEIIRGIHEQGGTFLGSSRGGADTGKIMDACVANGVNMVFVIGGDGSHRGAALMAEEAKRRGLKMCVVGVPKTIDNDIGVIDRSFGFHTAIAESKKAIMSAMVEASCTPNGIGIVKLMGREAGYIAAHSTLASREVDLCLIPELAVPLDGHDGVLAFVEKVMHKRGYAVIVVAEGAGADIMPPTGNKDESGNIVLPDIGAFLSRKLTSHFKAQGIPVSIKYHDPSYMIRSVPASAEDSVYAMSLAQNAVHGAFAGYTGFTSGLVNNRTVMIPFSVVSATSPSFLNPDGRTWERVLSLTHQPNWRGRPRNNKV